MAVVLMLLQILVPLLLKSAGNGSLAEIVETALRLARLVKPLLSDPKTVAALDALAGTITAFAPVPAQPEDPAMARVAPEHKFGGR